MTGTNGHSGVFRVTRASTFRLRRHGDISEENLREFIEIISLCFNSDLKLDCLLFQIKVGLKRQMQKGFSAPNFNKENLARRGGAGLLGGD